MMMQLMRDKEKEIDLNKYKRKFNVTKDFNDPKKEENELTSKPPKRIKHEKAEVQATSSRNRTPERHESTKSYKEKRHASPKKNRDEEDKHAIERRHTISSVGRHRSHERMEEKSRYHGRRSRSHEPRKDYKKGESERDKATKSRASSNDEKDRRKTRSEKHEAERSNVKEKRSHDEKRTPSRELKQENLSDVLSSYDRHGFQLPITKYDHLKALELFLRDSKKFDEMVGNVCIKARELTNFLLHVTVKDSCTIHAKVCEWGILEAFDCRLHGSCPFIGDFWEDGFLLLQQSLKQRRRDLLASISSHHQHAKATDWIKVSGRDA
jgi:hypothetical protein